MTAQVLPVNSESEHYVFKTTLAGDQFGFRFDYNKRDDHWYISMYDAAGVALFKGYRVVIGTYYGYRLAARNRPRGAITAIDTTGKGIDPGRYELGGRVILVFVDYA